VAIYAAAVGYFNAGRYDSAMEKFLAVRDYRDSEDYIAAMILIEAGSLICGDPEEAAAMLLSIKDYKGKIGELASEALYKIAADLMSGWHYGRAAAILEEIPGYRDADELLELCLNYVKRWQAVTYFERGEAEAAFAAFSELGDFSDCADYAAYLEAAGLAEAEDYLEAAEMFRSLGDFFDSRALYEKYAGLYYAEILDGGVYIGGSGRFGAEILAARISRDIPVYFISEAAEEARYIFDISGTSRYFGTYDDGTDAYAASVTVTLRDNEDGMILFSRSYAAYPPDEGYLPAGDIHAVFDFFEEDADGLSVYGRDILPLLDEIISLLYQASSRY
jgi:tetratricopeptide (TPR) repeat protein